MKKTLLCTIAFLVLVEVLALLAPSLTAEAQQTQLGVYPGQYFTYGTTDGSPWVSMYYGEPVPSIWQQYINFSTINFTITRNPDPADYPTDVFFNESVRFRNGIIKTYPNYTVDLNLGEGPGKVFFVPAGLVEGDQIYPGSQNDTEWVNATWTDHTNWPGREICGLNITRGTVPFNNTYFAKRTVNYWDQLTGALLSGFEEVAAFNATAQQTIEGVVFFQLIATNTGIPLDYPVPIDMTPIYIIIAVVIIAAIIAVARVVTSKPKKKPKRLAMTKS